MAGETRAGVVTEAARRNGHDEGRELVLYSGCQDCMVAQCKAGYPTSLAAVRFSVMFSD